MVKKIIKAVIFDMDGVISDTEIIQATAMSLVLAKNGIEMTPQEESARYAGIKSKVTFEEIFRVHNKINVDIDSLVEEKKRLVYDAVNKNIKTVPGTIEFIDELRGLGLPLAIGSAASLQFIDLVLSKLDLKKKFAAIASCYEIENGKPAPDVFLLAARQLNVAPEYCLVVEDGVNGMIAAKAAGMECVGLVRDNTGLKYPADLLVSDLRDKSVKETYEFKR